VYCNKKSNFSFNCLSDISHLSIKSDSKPFDCIGDSDSILEIIGAAWRVRKNLGDNYEPHGLRIWQNIVEEKYDK